MTWTPNRILACILGIVFLLIGLAGFFVSSSMEMGNLLGFDVDIVHNLVHLLTGIVALAAVFSGWSRIFNQVFGIIYLLVGVLGLIYPALYFNGLWLGVMHINAVDHGFHLLVGIVATGVGFFVQEPTLRRVRSET